MKSRPLAAFCERSNRSNIFRKNQDVGAKKHGTAAYILLQSHVGPSKIFVIAGRHCRPRHQKSGSELSGSTTGRSAPPPGELPAPPELPPSPGLKVSSLSLACTPPPVPPELPLPELLPVPPVEPFPVELPVPPVEPLPEEPFPAEPLLPLPLPELLPALPVALPPVPPAEPLLVPPVEPLPVLLPEPLSPLPVGLLPVGPAGLSEPPESEVPELPLSLLWLPLLELAG